MKELSILLYRDWLEFKKKYISYFLLWFSMPMIYYLFLVIPLSEYLNKAEAISGMFYRYWSLPGIWICSSGFLSFIYSFVKLKNITLNEEKLNQYLKAPLSNGQFLFSLLISSVIAGVVQLFISMVITIALNNMILNIFQVGVIFLNVVSIIIFFSMLGSLFAFYIKDDVLAMLFMFIVFIFLSFSCGTLIPIDNFPNNFLILIKNLPIYGIVLNTQLSYSNSSIIISPLIIINILNVIIFLIVLIISYKKFRK